MKLALVVSLILGLTSTVHNTPLRESRSLEDDLNDFLDLLPLQELIPIVKQYLATDPEIQEVIKYVKTDDFKKLVEKIESNEDVVSFIDYLNESGLDVHELVNQINGIIGLPPIQHGRRLYAISGGMSGLVQDIKALLPLDKIKAMYYDKLKNSEAFKQLIDRLHSPKLQTLVNKLMANKEFQYIVKTLKEAGINVQVVFDLISKILGIKFPEQKLKRFTRSLKDDFDDFDALLPSDKIFPILDEYVENDAEVQHVLEYVKTKEFGDLVTAFENIDNVLAFYDYLQESGLNVYEYINDIHKTIGLPTLKPHKRNFFKLTGGLAGLIADVKAVLPLDKIEALYNDKLETSKEFRNLIERLKSPKSQAIVDQLFQNKEFLHILEKAKQYGIDVKAIGDLLSSILGLKFPENKFYKMTRGLNEDLNDFLSLVPKQEVTKILFKYMEQDKEVQAAAEYAQSENFKNLVKVVENINDVRNFYDYLQSSGLDIYSAVNQLHDAIGLPHLEHRMLLVEITGGINGLIQDIKKVLPIDKIEQLYNKKFENSPEFKHLIERLRSPKFQAVVDTLFANEEFQQILKAAKQAGIDVKAIADLLSTIFGLKFPSTGSRSIRNVQTDLEDFIALLPIEEISKISITFIVKDPEVRNAVRYVGSQEFRDLLVKLQHEKDIEDAMQYINDSGLDIFSLIDLLNDALGVPHFPKPLEMSQIIREKPTTGVQGMLNAIRAVLPYDKIHALYEKKLRSSDDFRNFLKRFKKPEFQTIVDRLVVNEVFIELGHQASLHGIEIQSLTDFLKEILGIKLPERPPFPAKKVLNRKTTSLHEDLNEFLDLLPIDVIVSTTISYTLSDKETKEAILYMRSEEFKDIVRTLDRIPEYLEILKKLDAAGLDIYNWIETIHRFIGLDDTHPFSVYTSINKPGISGLIEKLKSLLPYEQIHDLYYEKLKTSTAFLDFVNLIKSDNFQTVTNKLFANKDFQNLLHEAQKHGVDLQEVADFFLRVFGIKTPPGIIES